MTAVKTRPMKRRRDTATANAIVVVEMDESDWLDFAEGVAFSVVSVYGFVVMGISVVVSSIVVVSRDVVMSVVIPVVGRSVVANGSM